MINLYKRTAAWLFLIGLLLPALAIGHPAEDSELKVSVLPDRVIVDLAIPASQLFWVAPSIFPKAQASGSLEEALSLYQQIDNAAAKTYLLDHILLESAEKPNFEQLPTYQTRTYQTRTYQTQVETLAVVNDGHQLLFNARIAFVPNIPMYTGLLSDGSQFNLHYDGLVHQIKNHRIAVQQLIAGTEQGGTFEVIKTLRNQNTQVNFTAVPG